MAFSRGIYPRWHIYLWEHGFIYEKGKVRQVSRWEQIESIEGATGFTDSGVGYTYKVHHRDGHTVKLDSNAFPKIAELIDDLLAEVTRQWASQETRIAHSKDMTIFTSIRLDQQGISNGQESIVWKDMQEITLKNGTMIVQRKGGINT